MLFSLAHWFSLSRYGSSYIFTVSCEHKRRYGTIINLQQNTKVSGLMLRLLIQYIGILYNLSQLKILDVQKMLPGEHVYLRTSFIFLLLLMQTRLERCTSG